MLAQHHLIVALVLPKEEVLKFSSLKFPALDRNRDFAQK
jgi:hypothetical protein